MTDSRQHTDGDRHAGHGALTFYLFQAAVWVALFYPFALGLHDDMGFAATLGIAIAVWVVSITLAEWIGVAGHRGPAEVLLRRLIYGAGGRARGEGLISSLPTGPRAKTPQPFRSAMRSRTRSRISSRMARTASMPCPAGSSSFQSS
ncbi:DUF418 domain-containing protein [Nonomuraea sp. SYSU D8015]|uniref:DUF418 domain-containing protein n=1 Tax=Nonomuraea sp. SYSU D8015 TaxID=2593644 RepID=UPI0016614466|nr:DUF418 domain-containing protein [Nonomuraea sp. SYSU D8015]